MILKRGSSGPLVMALQKRLANFASPPLVSDGQFGKATETAVRKYQNTQNLAVTGQVDEMLQARLKLASILVTSTSSNYEAPPNQGPFYVIESVPVADGKIVPPRWKLYVTLGLGALVVFLATGKRRARFF